MDISPLVREDLRKHWVSNQAVDALLMVPLVRRWSGLGVFIARIIYIYENQPWERALCWEAKRSLPDTVLVGYQHSKVPRLLLNFYLAPGGEDKAPLPDRVVTVGQHTARLLSADGYESERVRVGGALHLQNLLALRPQASKLSASANGATVLVATSNSREETAELVHMAARLFDENDGFRIVIKCHPLMPFQKVSSSTGGPLPKHVEVSDEPLADLILKSSVMVYSGSTVGIQALAFGLPLVHVRPQFDLDLDPLETAPHLRLEATGLEELRQTVLWLLCHREEYIAQHREKWNRFVDEMYGPVTEQTFLAFVECQSSS
jgi:surface carbohydrate biosynthesis protein (TIGR04326 family)